jgi:DNA adenine methylase
MKPIIKWSGGKHDELEKIRKHIPEKFDVYLEPFLGGGSVFFDVEPDRAVVGDVHKELVDFYNSLKKGKGNDIHEFMKDHPNTSEEYYKVRDQMTISSELDSAKRFYYLRKTCYRGMLRYNKKGKFNIPYGRYKTCNYEDVKDQKYKNVFRNTTIVNESFENIFEKYNSKTNFMFLDPPYDSEFTDYGYCSFDKEKQEQLAKCFKETNIQCLMIIGKTDYISKLYEGYIVEEYDKKYRFKLHSGRVGDEINTKHLVIKNF